jgi:hypothetical protein
MKGPLLPLRFIGEDVEVGFRTPPVLQKRPGCPDHFVWRGETWPVAEKLSEWHEYERRGRMARNMQPGHARLAARRGSWGVGRDYFQVRTEDGRIFELYYDRAPTGAGRRKGSWFLARELREEPFGTGPSASAGG